LAVTADGWRHAWIQLLPLNPAFEPIRLEPEDADELTIVGEFVRAADRSSALRADSL
jgi:SOS-response transcriptional repressor LexA